MNDEVVEMLQEFLDSNEWGSYDSESGFAYCRFCNSSELQSPITQIKHFENCLVVRAKKFIEKSKNTWTGYMSR